MPGSGAICGFILKYIWGVACLTSPSCVCQVTSSASSILRLRLLLFIYVFCSALIFLRFLLRIPFYISMLMPTSDGGVGAGTSRFAGPWSDVCANYPFRVSEIIPEYGVYLDSLLSVAMRMNGECASVWDVRFQRSCNTAAIT